METDKIIYTTLIFLPIIASVYEIYNLYRNQVYVADTVQTIKPIPEKEGYSVSCINYNYFNMLPYEIIENILLHSKYLSNIGIKMSLLVNPQLIIKIGKSNIYWNKRIKLLYNQDIYLNSKYVAISINNMLYSYNLCRKYNKHNNHKEICGPKCKQGCGPKYKAKCGPKNDFPYNINQISNPNLKYKEDKYRIFIETIIAIHNITLKNGCLSCFNTLIKEVKRKHPSILNDKNINTIYSPNKAFDHVVHGPLMYVIGNLIQLLNEAAYISEPL
jgi:hypothetical protein